MASLKADGDWLNVRFRDEAGGLVDLKFKRKHWWGGFIEGADAMFHCQNLEQGPALGIEAAQRPNFAAQSSVTKPDVGIVFLSRGRDGALIVNYKIVHAEITPPMIFIVREQSSIWWRYPSVELNR